MEVSEMLKYADNTFYGLKVIFANEIRAPAKHSGRIRP